MIVGNGRVGGKCIYQIHVSYMYGQRMLHTTGGAHINFAFLAPWGQGVRLVGGVEARRGEIMVAA